MTDVAKKLNCYKFVNEPILNHLHPAYGTAVFDRQYQKTESYGRIDQQTYLRRRANDFDL